MRSILAVLLSSSLLAGSSPLLAAAGDDGPLARAAVTEARRLGAANASQAPQQPAAQQRSWIGRHPVLFGALVGFAGGAAIGGATGGCGRGDFCVVSRGGAAVATGVIGAGVGSVVGLTIGLARK